MSPFKVIAVTVYSRTGCHLCESAIEELHKLQGEREFKLEVILIEGDAELEKRYGDQIPVTLINGKPHDFWRIDPERFRAALSQL